MLEMLSTIFFGEYIAATKQVKIALGIEDWINKTPAAYPDKLNIFIIKKPITGPKITLPTEEIKELLTGSNVKILTINGLVVKDFKLQYNENKLQWDGRDKSNQLVNTGIYFITSYNQNKSITKKIAIIRN